MEKDKFEAYIERHGDDVCAERWGKATRTVAGWRRGEARPTRFDAQKIVALSATIGPRLTLADILSYVVRK